MPQDEPDSHNFSPSPDNRLPAITGAEALQNDIEGARGISTGLPILDTCMNLNPKRVISNGIRRGCVTEIYGPPGSGKSTFGIQIAVNSTRTIGKAVWISAGTPLVRSRLEDITAAHTPSMNGEPPSSPPEVTAPQPEGTQGLTYKEVHSLPHLLIMLMHYNLVFPPPNTATLVIDGLPNLLMSAFPRQLRGKDPSSSILRENAAKVAAGKRQQMIENLAGALSQLARSRHIAIIILNKTTTSMKGGQRALLKPAFGGQAWDAAVNTRIVLYRDLYPRHLQKKLNVREKRGYRLAEVVRLGAKEVGRDPVPFIIETGGLRELPISGFPAETSPPLPGSDLIDSETLQIRTSQPETRTTVPLITQNNFPTASQMPRNQSSPPLQSTPVPVPVEDPTADQNPAATGLSSSQTRPSKRKATEIADSEDEDNDAGPPVSSVAQSQDEGLDKTSTSNPDLWSTPPAPNVMQPQDDAWPEPKTMHHGL